MKSLIILDRDGVINFDSPHYIKSTEEWQPIPGSIEAIAKLKAAGHLVAVATNQSGIARGYFSEATLHDMHQKLNDLLGSHNATLDGIYYCPHGPEDGCECRKPLPGMVKQIQQDLTGPFEHVIMIGDALRDLEAGISGGAKPVLVLTGKGEKTLSTLPETLKSTPVFDSLAAFTSQFLASDQPLV